MNVTPIREIDGRHIGTGELPVTKKMLRLYLDVIHGKVSRYRSWLTYVR